MKLTHANVSTLLTTYHITVVNTESHCEVLSDTIGSTNLYVVNKTSARPGQNSARQEGCPGWRLRHIVTQEVDHNPDGTRKDWASNKSKIAGKTPTWAPLTESTSWGGIQRNTLTMTDAKADEGRSAGTLLRNILGRRMSADTYRLQKSWVKLRHAMQHVLLQQCLFGFFIMSKCWVLIMISSASSVCHKVEGQPKWGTHWCRNWRCFFFGNTTVIQRKLQQVKLMVNNNKNSNKDIWNTRSGTIRWQKPESLYITKGQSTKYNSDVNN